jgi:hypothetical protein
MYIVSGCMGSMAIPLTPKFGKRSVLVLHVVPLSVDFHNPPAGAPAKMVFGAVAVIKKNAMYFGSVGMPFSLNHASSDDTRNRCANFVNTFNGQTNVGQRK